MLKNKILVFTLIKSIRRRNVLANKFSFLSLFTAIIVKQRRIRCLKNHKKINKITRVSTQTHVLIQNSKVYRLNGKD